ncbi:hypothetical protein SRHO_G00018080 [Serrasalmus rhombeus]
MKPKERKALDLSLHAQASSILPPIKGCCPPPAQAMKGELCMEKLKKTPELEKEGSKVFLIAPVQQHEDDQSQVEKLSSASVSKAVIKEAAEVVVKELESSFDVRFPVYFLYNHLIDDLMEELELLAGIKVTCQWTVGYIADAVLKAFINYALECVQSRSLFPDTDAVEETSPGLGLPEVQEDPFDPSAPETEQHSRTNVCETRVEDPVPRNRSAQSCSTILRELSSSEIEELIREFDGSTNSDVSESS